MAYERTRDLLKKAGKLHHSMAGYYAAQENAVQSEKVKLLLEYLRGHEIRLEKAFEELERDTPKDVLDTWFDFTPDPDEWGLPDDFHLNPDSSLDDVLDQTLTLEERLVNVYQEISRNCQTEEVRELFENLLDNARRERKTFVRDILMFKET